jgi:hypothetical protein
MIDRSKRPSSIVRRKAQYRLNEIAEAPPSRRQRVGLIAQRASRTRISARVRVTLSQHRTVFQRYQRVLDDPLNC